MSRPLVIWGAGGLAATVADIVRLQSEFEIAGFLDDVNPQRHGSRFCDANIFGGMAQLDSLRHRGIEHVFIAFGDCAARLRALPELHARGYQMPILIHPQATVATAAELGPGVLLRAAAVVEVGSRLGESVLIGPGAIVGHQSVLADGVRLAIGATLAGHVEVGRGALVAAGATVIDRIRIGAGAIVGAGAVVVRDVPPGVIAYGVPARVVRPVV